MTPLRIVTWNLAANTVSRSWGVHVSAWRALIGLRPDIALVQEALPPPTWLIRDGALARDRSETRWTSMILARESALFEVAGHRDLREHGRLTTARAEILDQSALLASLHAKTEPATVPHLEALVTRVWETAEGGQVILGGDFNSCRAAEAAWPGLGHLAFFERLDQRMFNCHWRLHGREEQTFLRKGSRPFQDDHIFVSPNLGSRIRKCEVLTSAAFASVSDHLPIRVELDLSPR